MFLKMYKIKTEWKSSNISLGLQDLVISYFLWSLLCHECYILRYHMLTYYQ